MPGTKGTIITGIAFAESTVVETLNAICLKLERHQRVRVTATAADG